MVGLDKLQAGECLFIINGILPNRQSTPVVDAWFALRFKNGQFDGELSMEELLSETHYGRTDTPNRNLISEEHTKQMQAILPKAVHEARRILSRKRQEYMIRINPLLDQELNKLLELEGRHKQAIEQLSMLETVKGHRIGKVEELFKELTAWMENTLETEDRPYLRVIAAFTGVGV